MDSELLSDTFVDLADTMVADFDIIDFLHMLPDRSTAILAASAAGVVLAYPRGEPRGVGEARGGGGTAELFSLQKEQKT
ncbi:MAG: transcriptional regulator, partial [Streptosporangiaceae bacterium]